MMMAKRKAKAEDTAVVDEQVVEETVDAVESAEDVAEAEVAPAQLQLNDLNGLLRIVDVAMKRGAFQANEATAVGAVYDKLSAFVTHAMAQQAEAKAEEAGDEGEE